VNIIEINTMKTTLSIFFRYVIITMLISTCFACENSAERPNVLFIAIDDLNDYVNCMHGSVSALTPNIDKLARQGVLFSNAHCQAPICGPSRAGIMTGLYPSTSGNYLQVNDEDIMKSNETVASAILMPDYFEQNGYKTMAVGKIYHQGDKAKSFDEYGGKFSFYGPFPEERFNYDPSKIPGKTSGTMTDWAAFPEHDSMLADFQSAAWAAGKLKQHHEQPFFLAVGFVRPHVPWYVPQKWFDLYDMDTIDLPPYLPEDMDDVPSIGKQVAEAPMMPTTEELIESGEWSDVVQAYLACITFVDAQVGKLIEVLEESDYADNTIIVLWADHGYHLGEKNRFAKQALWERDTRTVMIFKEPGKLQSKECNASVQLIDIYPTLTELCGLPDYEMADGNSLVPYLADVDLDIENPALSFYGKGNIAVRTKDHRLIRYEDGSIEFYDMNNDPQEWNNLAGDTSYSRLIDSLSKYIPSDWAPLSSFSSYNFNSYFKAKSFSETSLE